MSHKGLESEFPSSKWLVINSGHFDTTLGKV